MKKRFAALLFLASMLLCNSLVLYASEAKSDDNDSNANAASETEEWVYQPLYDSESDNSISLLTVDDTEDDSVEITVNAVDKDSGETVPVEGAQVNLYTGTRYVRSALTGENGIAELDLSDLSVEEKLDSTVSASKTISQGKGIQGSDRDFLYNSFPHDSSGNYIRYSYELHSEHIDENGNWCGEEVPITLEKNKVDIAFVIDATGSMSSYITAVKNNITTFAQTLIDNDLDVRFSIIEYRDITQSEETTLHTYNGSNWYTDTADVISVLGDIKADGGGDTPETVMDALGMAATDAMQWRSGASRFAFVLTDANYKTNNNYGYSSMDDLITELSRQKIATSVITKSSYQSTYQALYETTGGIYANISNSTFYSEMQNLAESVVTAAAGDMTLTLSEPRIRYNMSVCYLADNKTSQSQDYYNSMKTMLNEYANDMAQATDGHILIDKVILFSTDNRLNFYDSTNKACMADIQIQTREKDDGTWLSNIFIHSVSNVNGFYFSDKESSGDGTEGDQISHFKNLKNVDEYKNRDIYYSILLSATEGAGWNNSFIDAYAQYATTVTHESGHYILGFFDEYLDQDGNPIETYPNGDRFGLMDNQHEDIEMSKNGIDYAYFGGSIPSGRDDRHTLQSSMYQASCEEYLASGRMEEGVKNGDTILVDSGPYRASYTRASGTTDRTAGYSYAGLEDADYISVTGTGINTLAVADKEASYFEDMDISNESYGDMTYAGGSGKISLSFTPSDTASYELYLRKTGESGFSKCTFTRSGSVYKADLDLDYNEMAEMYLVRTLSGESKCKYYTLEHSAKAAVGYIFQTVGNTVIGYVSNNKETAYTIVDDCSSYSNGEYISVNNAVVINDDQAGSITDGELYSVASKDAEINYESVSWFCYKDGVWTQLDTDLSEEENHNIGARTDIASSGLYVLMAKKASASKAAAVTGLTYSQDDTTDSIVTLHFTDSNKDTKLYNIYYSESDFTDSSATLIKKTYACDGTDIDVNLYERDRTVYLAVEVVLEDGRRSDLAKVKITTTAADSDGDGIPDWYCDEYRLWPEDGTTKDIANSDDDGDGLTNLEEYKGGSDPKNPNDPVHTTTIPVKTISLDQTSLSLSIGDTVTVKAEISPSDATNQKVSWKADDTSIVKITASGLSCKLEALAGGSTTLRAVTGDGGYVATCTIEVKNHSHSWDSGKVLLQPTESKTGSILYTCTTCDETKKSTIPCLDQAGSTDKVTSYIPADAYVYDGHSYYVYEVNDGTSYEEAEKLCEAKGGHLATINSEEEDKVVYAIMKVSGYDSAFFGLCDTSDGSGSWINGEISTYRNWASGEPNGQDGIEDKGMYYVKYPNGKWNDGSPAESYAYLCEWDLKKAGHVSIDSSAYVYDGHSYKAYEGAANYAAAQAFCEAMGGHLAVISSEEENKTLTSYLQTVNNNTEYVIGLYDGDGGSGSWDSWVTGEKVSYSNWAETQPDSIYDDQYVGAISTYDSEKWGFKAGQWDNVPDSTYGFVCEWDDVIKSTETESTATSRKASTIKLTNRNWMYGYNQTYGYGWLDASNISDYKNRSKTIVKFRFTKGTKTWTYTDVYERLSSGGVRRSPTGTYPKDAGTYKIQATLLADDTHEAATSNTVTGTIRKYGGGIFNMSFGNKTKTVKYSKVKKKAVTLSGVSVYYGYSSWKLSYTYKKLSGSSKYLKVNKKTGKITVKKGTKKGKYKLKLKVSFAGNANVLATSKTVTVVVKVK